MTHAKAASLTSALFAKKGAASPASLLIAEIDEDAEDEPSLPRTAVRGRGKAASQRKKASLPEIEQDLPLLAFVEAQAADDEAARAADDKTVTEKAAAAQAGPAKGDAVNTTVDDVAVVDAAAAQGKQPARDDQKVEPSPAASLLAGRSFALWVESGSTVAGNGADQRAQSKVSQSSADGGEDSAVEPPALDAETTPEPSPGLEPLQKETRVPRSADPLSSEETGAEKSSSNAPELRVEAVKKPGNDDISAADGGKQQSVSEPDSETEGQSNPKPESETVLQFVSTLATVERNDQAPAEPAPQNVEPPTDCSERSKSPEKAPQASTPAPKPALADLAALQVGERRPAISTLQSARAMIPAHLQERPWAKAAAVVLLGVVLGFGGYAVWPREAAPPAEPAMSRDQTPPVQADAVSTSKGGAVSGETAPATAGEPTHSADPQLGSMGSGSMGSGSIGSGSVGQFSAGPTGSEPSFDIIRIEPNGQSIIAGRADPYSEWILLNNGEPIGSVKADANGEWVILPDEALVPGANAFSLVPKAERGRVAIPGGGAAERQTPVEKPLPPQSDAGGVSEPDGTMHLFDDTPLPRMKPAERSPDWSLAEQIQVVAAGGYEIQFASVRENAAAEQERRRLIAAYPELLADLALQVREASIQGAGVFYRLRSGPIDDLGRAREVCRLLERRGQGCLVVVRSEPATPVTLPEPKPSGAVTPGLAPTQQAERPE